MQTNFYLHKYLTASEWHVLQNPTAPYYEKLMTLLRVKERLGDMSKQGTYCQISVRQSKGRALCQQMMQHISVRRKRSAYEALHTPKPSEGTVISKHVVIRLITRVRTHWS